MPKGRILGPLQARWGGGAMAAAELPGQTFCAPGVATWHWLARRNIVEEGKHVCVRCGWEGSGFACKQR
eukprot:1159756-Pelagomonas_calceolata.AAC.13